MEEKLTITLDNGRKIEVTPEMYEELTNGKEPAHDEKPTD